tara:strand:- start:102 stop:329 length:228 start_codon:yes stop_codon:yes gene_type:complete
MEVHQAVVVVVVEQLLSEQILIQVVETEVQEHQIILQDQLLHMAVVVEDLELVAVQDQVEQVVVEQEMLQLQHQE